MDRKPGFKQYGHRHKMLNGFEVEYGPAGYEIVGDGEPVADTSVRRDMDQQQTAEAQRQTALRWARGEPEARPLEQPTPATQASALGPTPPPTSTLTSRIDSVDTKLDLLMARVDTLASAVDKIAVYLGTK